MSPCIETADETDKAGIRTSATRQSPTLRIHFREPRIRRPIDPAEPAPATEPAGPDDPSAPAPPVTEPSTPGHPVPFSLQQYRRFKDAGNSMGGDPTPSRCFATQRVPAGQGLAAHQTAVFATPAAAGSCSAIPAAQAAGGRVFSGCALKRPSRTDVRRCAVVRHPQKPAG